MWGAVFFVVAFTATAVSAHSCYFEDEVGPDVCMNYTYAVRTGIQCREDCCLDGDCYGFDVINRHECIIFDSCTDADTAAPYSGNIRKKITYTDSLYCPVPPFDRRFPGGKSSDHDGKSSNKTSRPGKKGKGRGRGRHRRDSPFRHQGFGGNHYPAGRDCRACDRDTSRACVDGFRAYCHEMGHGGVFVDRTDLSDCLASCTMDATCTGVTWWPGHQCFHHDDDPTVVCDMPTSAFYEKCEDTSTTAGSTVTATTESAASTSTGGAETTTEEATTEAGAAGSTTAAILPA